MFKKTRSPRANEFGELRCSKCETYKPTDDFHKLCYSPDGFHNQCKDCRKEYAQTEDGKAAKRRYNQNYMLKRLAELDGTEYTPNTPGKEDYSKSAIAFLKNRDKKTWEAISFEYDVSVQTLMAWQRNGCPRRKCRAAYRFIADLRRHYEQLVMMGIGNEAQEFYDFCKADGWNLL